MSRQKVFLLALLFVVVLSAIALYFINKTQPDIQTAPEVDQEQERIRKEVNSLPRPEALSPEYTEDITKRVQDLERPQGDNLLSDEDIRKEIDSLPNPNTSNR